MAILGGKWRHCPWNKKPFFYVDNISRNHKRPHLLGLCSTKTMYGLPIKIRFWRQKKKTNSANKRLIYILFWLAHYITIVYTKQHKTVELSVVYRVYHLDMVDFEELLFIAISFTFSAYNSVVVLIANVIWLQTWFPRSIPSSQNILKRIKMTIW